MNKEEIIQNVLMRDILAQRGIPINHNNMCSCPFHGRDKRPSMKIYKDGFKCFACNESGNQIDFVMKYDGLSFKDAYLSLGGTYEHMNEGARIIANRKWERAKAEREQREKDEAQFKNELSRMIALTRKAIEVLEPMEEDWCFFQNKLPILLNAWRLKYEVEEEIDEINVIKLCREIRQRIDFVCRIV